MQRDFTFVDDIIAGVKASLFSDNLDKYEIFNIGNLRSEKLIDMIIILADALGIEPKMEMMPMQPGDVPATYADIDRIHTKLGYKPTTPISQGIPKFIDWYKTYHKID
jgi:UDP-glucuronate 4-epimerase